MKACGCGMSGGGNEYRQGRVGAHHAAGRVEHAHSIVARLARLDVGQQQYAVGSARDVHTPEAPLVAERRRAASNGHTEARALIANRRRRLWLDGDARRELDNQHRRRTGDRTGRIGNNRPIKPGIGRRDVEQVEGGVRRVGNRSLFKLPLVGERRRAAHAHAERDVRVGGHHAILRGRGDGRKTRRQIFARTPGGRRFGAPVERVAPVVQQI